MKVFASRDLRDLVTHDGDVCLKCWGLVPRPGVTYVHDDGTLCECDTLDLVLSQIHPVNPILAWFRGATEPSRNHDAATYVVTHWTDTIGALNAQGYDVTVDHEIHALIVLIRLARITQGG